MTAGAAVLPCRGAGEIDDSVVAGETSAIAETDAALARIKARDGGVRAWRWLDTDVSRSQARAVENAPDKGPLAGAGVGLKDIIGT